MLRLFAAAHTPAMTDTLSTYTAIEASFSGYAPVTIERTIGINTWNTPSLTGGLIDPINTNAKASYGSQLSWSLSSSQIIYGHFWSAPTSNVAILAEQWATPLAAISGSLISLRPSLELGGPRTSLVWRHIQSAGATTFAANSLSATFPGAISEGNLIVVGLGNDTSGGTFTITDNFNGIPYSEAVVGGGLVASGTVGIYWFIVPPQGGGYPFTVTFACDNPVATTYPVISVDEYMFPTNTLVFLGATGSGESSGTLAQISAGTTNILQQESNTQPGSSLLLESLYRLRTESIPLLPAVGSSMCYSTVKSWGSSNQVITPSNGFSPRYSIPWNSASPVNPTYIDVTDFGAVGDGITDDIIAIQAAVDSVPVGGGTVFIPAGDYRISDSIAIHIDGTTLTGEGPSSIIRLVDEVIQSGIILPLRYGDSLDPANVVDNVTISNLALDGNHNPNVYSYGVPHPPDYFGIFIRQATYVTLSNVIVRNWSSDGIAVANGNVVVDHLIIEDCLVDAVGRNGIHIGFATNAIIRRNRIYDCPSQWWGPAACNGIDVEVEGNNAAHTFPGYEGYFAYPYVIGMSITDNVIDRPYTETAGDGIALQPAYGPLHDVTISNNIIKGYQFGVGTYGSLGGYGVGLTSVKDVTIENNWISSGTLFAISGEPIKLEGTTNVLVQNNVLNDETNGNFSGGGTNSAINIGNTYYAQILNNTIRLSQSWLNAISKIYWGSHDITITGNQYQTYQNTQAVLVWESLKYNNTYVSSVTNGGYTITLSGTPTSDGTAPVLQAGQYIEVFYYDPNPDLGYWSYQYLIANISGATITITTPYANATLVGTSNNVWHMVTTTNYACGSNITIANNTTLNPSTWDITPPSVSPGITNGTTISALTEITATATDSGSGVAKVHYFVDRIPRGFTDTAPYVFTVDPNQYKSGSHTFGVLAVDNAANLSAESDVNLEFISSPANGLFSEDRVNAIGNLDTSVMLNPASNWVLASAVFQTTGWFHVQGTGQTTFELNPQDPLYPTLDATFPQTVTAGNLIVVGLGNDVNGGTFVVSDNINHVPYEVAATAGTVGTATILWFIVPEGGGGNPFTISFSSQNRTYPVMSIDEYVIPVGSSVTVDSYDGAEGVNSLATSGTSLTVTSLDLICSVCKAWGTESQFISPPVGFESRYNVGWSGSPAVNGINFADGINRNRDIMPSFVLSPASNWVIASVAFKASSQAQPNTFMLLGLL